MAYRLMGRAHALAVTLRDGERGQGTVEYVGLILLISAVLLAVVKFGHGFKGDELGTTIVNKLKSAIDGADPGTPKGK
jgi:Flp pilus assembly pilin Flp